MTVDTRKVIVCMDNNGSDTCTEIDYVVNKLKEAGFNAERSSVKQSGYCGKGVGPSVHINTIEKYRYNTSNMIIFSIMNGSDAGIFLELKQSYSCIDFRKSSKNNTVCLGFYANAGDFYNENGQYYKWLIRAHDDNYSPRSFKGLKHPKQYLFNLGIPIAWGMNNVKSKTSRSQTLDQVIKQFIFLFSNENWKIQVGLKKGDYDDPNKTDDDDDDDDDNNNDNNTDTSTITTRITEKTYSKAYYQQIVTATTENTGAFTKQVDLPYAGEYTINLFYAGNGKSHGPSEKTVTIKHYHGKTFTESLLQTKTTTTDKDGKTTTKTTGTIPKNTHTYTIITTETLKDGKVTNKTTIRRDNDTNITDTGTDNTTDITDPDTDKNTNTDVSNTKDPFTTAVTVKTNGIPDVKAMSTKIDDRTILFEHLDKEKTYTLNKRRYKAVMNMDSQILQIQKSVSAYTAFLCEEVPNTYIVIPRENWNAVQEALNYHMVSLRGGDWPEKIKIDFTNKKIICDNTSVSMKAQKVYHIGVRDRQNTGHSCGPTSMSACTQMLHHYYSEQYWMKHISGGYSSSGTAPSAHRTGFNNHDFYAVSWGGNMDTLQEAIEDGGAAVGHHPGHYVCIADYNPNTDHFLVLNSAGSSYGPRGWVSRSKVNSYCTSNGSIVYSRWKNLTEERKKALKYFYTSMGGQWKRTFKEGEKIREYR